MTTSTPSTSKAKKHRPHPAWMILSGWSMASAPACAGLETTANVIRAERPIPIKAVTTSVIGVERRVRIFVHSERTVSENSGARPGYLHRRGDGLGHWAAPVGAALRGLLGRGLLGPPLLLSVELDVVTGELHERLFERGLLRGTARARARRPGKRCRRWQLAPGR